METRYCVFWIPSTGHKEPAILPKVKSNERLAIRTVDISDGYSSAKNIPGQKVWLRTRIDVQNELKRDIRVTLRVTYLSEKKQNPRKFDKKDIVLEYIDACRNGMLLYKYRFNNSCPLELAIDKAMPFAVYHLIKGYFHEHEYHSEEKDSLLEAYIQPTRINIKKCDNEALIFYLKGFEEQFAFYNKTLRNNLNEINEVCTRLKSKLIIDENNEAKDKSKSRQKEDLANLYNIVRDKRKKIDDECAKMIGFAIYAEALLKSWYNSNYHPHWIFEKYSFKLTRSRLRLKAINNFNEDAKRGLNRLAINIKRSISSIIFTKEKNLFAQQQDTAYFQHQNMLLLKGAINETKRAISKGDERAGCLWIFGIGIAVVTCLISVCVSTCLSDNTDEKIKELQDTIQQDAATNKTLIENNAFMIKSALNNDSTSLNMIENKNRSSKQQRAK